MCCNYLQVVRNCFLWHSQEDNHPQKIKNQVRHLEIFFQIEWIRDLGWTLVKEVRWLFRVAFDLYQLTFLGAAWSLPEIGLSLKPNHHSHVSLVQIPDTHCRKRKRNKKWQNVLTFWHYLFYYQTRLTKLTYLYALI